MNKNDGTGEEMGQGHIPEPREGGQNVDSEREVPLHNPREASPKGGKRPADIKTTESARKYSRYQGGCPDDVPLITHGSIPLSASRVRSVEEAQAEIREESALAQNCSVSGIEYSRKELHEGHLKQDRRPLDHGGCCPKCCVEQDCHNGCLGHAATLFPAESHTIKDTLFDKKAKPEHASIAIVKQALNDWRDWRTPREQGDVVVELPTPAPLTDVDKLWGGTPFPGAIAVARTAMSGGSPGSSPESPGSKPKNPKPSPELSVSKVRSRSATVLEHTNCDTHEEERAQQQRNISWSTVITTPKSSAAAERHSKRSTSDSSFASLRTLDIPYFGTVGAILESLLIPIRAVRMWVSQHPQVVVCGLQVVGHLAEMVHITMETVRRLWKVSYVYSKTGKIVIKAQDGVGWFVLDVVRSGAYILILAAIAVLLCKIVAFVVRGMAWVLWVAKGFGWIAKVLGMELLW